MYVYNTLLCNVLCFDLEGKKWRRQVVLSSFLVAIVESAPTKVHFVKFAYTGFVVVAYPSVPVTTRNIRSQRVVGAVLVVSSIR